MEVSVKSLTFSCFICALNLYFAQKAAQKGKICSRLLEPQKVAPNAKSCSKVAEHNRDKPSHLEPIYAWSIRGQPSTVFMSLQSAVMGRVPLGPSHVISLRVDRACLQEKVPGHCRKGTEMVGTTYSPPRIFIFEGGGVIWKKKKKKNSQDKVVCFDNKTGWSIYHSLALSLLEEHNFNIHDTGIWSVRIWSQLLSKQYSLICISTHYHRRCA